MSTSELITLIVALAALTTSVVTAYEMIRQNKNAVRPAVIVIEKTGEKKYGDEDLLGLYLCNMGNAVALNMKIVASNHRKVLENQHLAAGKIPAETQREVASNRRALLGTGYKKTLVKNIALAVTYEDVNKTVYYTVFGGGKMTHQMGKGPVPSKLLAQVVDGASSQSEQST